MVAPAARVGQQPVGVAESDQAQRHQFAIKQRVAFEFTQRLAEAAGLRAIGKRHALHEARGDVGGILGEHGGDRADDGGRTAGA